MATYKAGDNLPEKPDCVILLYGKPGSRKTSMAAQSTKPIIIDFDRGIWRAKGIKDIDKIVIEKGWYEVENAIADSGLLDNTTIICDTVKTALDNYLTQALFEEDHTLKSKTGGLVISGYQALSNRFKKSYITPLRGKILVFIAHSKSVEEGDQTTYAPDITGATAAIVMQMADQVGFVTKVGEDIFINFKSSDKYESKDTAGIGNIRVPNLDEKAWPNFFQREVIDPTITALNMSSQKTTKEESRIMEFEDRIGNLSSVDEFNAMIKEVTPIRPLSTKSLIVDKLMKAAAAHNLEFDNRLKNFKEKNIVNETSSSDN